MKSHSVAFALSFFLPGAGLFYLGKWKWGFMNLGVVFAIGFILALALPDDTFNSIIKPVALGCSGGSGALAQSIAQEMNKSAG